MNCCNCPIRELGTDTVTADMPAPLTSKSASWKCGSVPSRFISAQNSKLTSEVWCSSELRGSVAELQGALACRRDGGKGAAFLDLLQTSHGDRKHLQQLCFNDRKLALCFFERERERHSSTSFKSLRFTKVSRYLHPREQMKSL